MRSRNPVREPVRHILRCSPPGKSKDHPKAPRRACVRAAPAGCATAAARWRLSAERSSLVAVQAARARGSRAAPRSAASPGTHRNAAAWCRRSRRDRRGARAPDARNLLDLVYRIRESAAVLGDELSSGPMQVARAGVVAEAAPEPQHLVLVRASERPHVGKAGHEALVIGNDRCHLRLLQHHFREPDAVWVPRALPGKPFAPVTALPGDEKACESGHPRILMGAWAAPSSASANTTAS